MSLLVEVEVSWRVNIGSGKVVRASGEGGRCISKVLSKAVDNFMSLNFAVWSDVSQAE